MVDVALQFRAATIADASQLRRWRNDPLTRAASIRTAAVGEDEHRQWLDALLQNPKRELLIALRRDLAVGCVRFDRLEQELEMSWTVAPEARGHGIGSKMVRQAAADRPEALMAKVRKDNHASARIAEAAGFQLAEEDQEIRVFRRAATGS